MVVRISAELNTSALYHILTVLMSFVRVVDFFIFLFKCS